MPILPKKDTQYPRLAVLTQTLIIHVIRTNKLPFIPNQASKALIFASLAIVAFGTHLSYSSLAGWLGFTPLPRAN